MTEAQIKEAISKEFLRILANGNGFKVTEPPLDHGVDMIVCPVTVRTTTLGGLRYLDSPISWIFNLSRRLLGESSMMAIRSSTIWSPKPTMTLFLGGLSICQCTSFLLCSNRNRQHVFR